MVAATVYVAGVIVGLLVMRDPWPARLGTALVWPLGPIAFAVVVTGLLVAALVLWPMVMVPVAALLGALAWWMT